MKCLRPLMLAMLLAICTVRAAGQAFVYPSVPDTLRTPDTRAAWLMRHYWDRFSFADTAFLASPADVEQAFVNYIDLAQRVSSAVAADGMRLFVERMYNDGTECVREYFATLADSYLGGDASPVRDDLLYAQYLDIAAASKFASIAERTRNEYMARNLRRNLPGTVAADFEYDDRQGHRHRMHDFAAPKTLLYFYDPDCSHCRDMLGSLLGIPALAEGGSVRVLAIYPYGYDDRWAASAPPFPPSWTDGCSAGGDVSARDIYYIKSMPSLYLLDADKRVLLKNPTIGVLHDVLGRE